MEDPALQLRKVVGKFVLLLAGVWVMILIASLASLAQGGSGIPALNWMMILLPGCALVPGAIFSVRLLQADEPDRVRDLWMKSAIYGVAGVAIGMRWGELAGLATTNTHLGDGLIHVHKDNGALHEVSGQLYLGPPKSAAAVRDIHLPPFLITLLQEVIDSHDHDMVFCDARGAYLRRSAMSRRVWRPAVYGNPHTGTSPVLDGMRFHDTRHTHKAWLIEDDIPESSKPAGSDTDSPASAGPTATSPRP